MRQSKEKNELIGWIKLISLTLIITFGIRYFVFTPISVDGASMMPTLHDDDKIVLNIIEPKLMGYDRFDIVVFEVSPEVNYIKRIIGLPGDHVLYEDDTLYINGAEVEEPFLQTLRDELTYGKLTGNFKLEDLYEIEVIPEGYYFVLGDNRLFTIDSRDTVKVGLVSKDKILGKADLILYPFSNTKLIR